MSAMSVTMPPPRIGRVALSVTDLDRSIRFYEDVIGLQALGQDDEYIRLGVGDEPMLLLHQQEAARPVQRAAGLYHFAILVPSRRDLGLVLQHLLQANGPISGYADHTVSEAIYLTDPDGHGIEIYRDRPREKWFSPDGNFILTTEPLDVRGVLAEAGADPGRFQGMPDGTFLGHIHLQVAQIPATENFYMGLLGFDLMARYGPRASFMSANGYHHHIGANTWAGNDLPPAPKDAARLLWFEIRQPDAAALDTIAGRLTAAGRSTGRQNGYLWAEDPSGIRVLLSASEP